MGDSARLAEQYGIDISPTSQELPTLLLFYKGDYFPNLRLPPPKKGGIMSKLQKIIINEDSIIKAFDLDTHTNHQPHFTNSKKANPKPALPPTLSKKVMARQKKSL